MDCMSGAHGYGEDEGFRKLLGLEALQLHYSNYVRGTTLAKTRFLFVILIAKSKYTSWSERQLETYTRPEGMICLVCSQ